MNTTEIDAFILRIKGSIGSDKKNKDEQHVTDTYKAKKSWKEAFALVSQGKDHMRKTVKEIERDLRKMLEVVVACDKKQMATWTDIHEELEIPDSKKCQYNEETEMIEVVDKYKFEVDEE